MTPNDKDIEQLFQEIRIMDEAVAPDFTETWEAANRRRFSRRIFLKRAVAVLLIVGLGLSGLVFNQNRDQDSNEVAISISEWHPATDFSLELPNISNWKSPTDFSTSFGSASVSELSSWQSPTDFLLQVSN